MVHITYVVGPNFSGLTYKKRAEWNMLRGIYSAIFGEVNIPTLWTVVIGQSRLLAVVE